MTKHLGIMAPRRAWSEFEVEVLRMHYATTLTHLLAELFRRPEGQVYAQAHRIGLHKAEEFQATSASGRIALRGGALEHRNTVQARPGATEQGQEDARLCAGQHGQDAIQAWIEARDLATGWHMRDQPRRVSLDKKRRRWHRPAALVLEAGASLGVDPRPMARFPRATWSSSRWASSPTCSRRSPSTGSSASTRRELMLRNTFHNLPQPLREIVHLRLRNHQRDQPPRQRGFPCRKNIDDLRTALFEHARRSAGRHSGHRPCAGHQRDRKDDLRYREG